ncbi:MAG: hypothetical protein C0501_22450 [Isosphaera sp.]|nr:hypothetical protein [Isosphaera sp.]
MPSRTGSSPPPRSRSGCSPTSAPSPPTRSNRQSVETALANTAIAADLRVTRPTVGKWRQRFLDKRLDGLTDGPRPGPPRAITDAQVEDVVTRTLESEPADATHWSTRGMADATGLSQTAISRIWRAFGLQPHRPVLRGEGPGRGRPVPAPARPGRRVQRGRGVPGPGAGPDPTGPPDDPRPGRAGHPRLRPARRSSPPWTWRPGR